jgi:hypothetical protein
MKNDASGTEIKIKSKIKSKEGETPSMMGAVMRLREKTWHTWHTRTEVE